MTLGFATEDASAFGFVVTGLYGVVTILCTIAADRVSGRFWAAMAITLCLLGLNKQLDLQTDMLAFGRALALREGWYGWRRVLEAAALPAFALSLLAMLAIGVRMGAGRAGGGLALCGAGLVAVYVALRATDILHLSAKDAPPVALLEPAGLLLILYGAVRAIRRASPASRTGGIANGRSGRPDR